MKPILIIISSLCLLLTACRPVCILPTANGVRTIWFTAPTNNEMGVMF